MFYAHFVLAKKGPLSKIWLAAHWDKKLTKAHVFETNIETSVDGILKPKVKMALRTSGHLLLGVVRIYSRKAKYLLQDCNEAFVKIKMAFRPGMVDLPEEHREAAMNAITLPEVFHDFDTAMPELNEVDIEAQFSLNQSRAEEITMREDYGSLNLVTHDDGFGDMGFDTDNPDIMREAIGNEGMEQSNLLFADGSSLELAGKDAEVPGTSGIPSLSAPEHERQMEAAPHNPMDDGFGGTIGDVGDFGHAGGLFEGDLFGDVTATHGGGALAARPRDSLHADMEGAGAVAEGADPDSDDDMPDHYDAGNSPQHSWAGSPVPPPEPAERGAETDLMPPPAVPRPPSVRPMEVDMLGAESGSELRAESPAPPPASPAPPPPPAASPPRLDHTTLLQNEEESFALAPVDATVLKGITKSKRKRKLIVDEVKNISGEEMKNQLSNTSDIVTSLDLAPPTRRLMHWKETGGVEKLFTLPARSIPSRALFKKYQRNMTQRNEAEEAEREREREAPRRTADEEPTRRQTRKRKLDEIAPPETPAPPSVAPLDMDVPTPVPQDYEPSAEQEAPATPGYATSRDDIEEAPNTPGMLSSLGPLTPGALGPLTPGGLGPLTPGGLGPLTPGGLGPLTPGGLGPLTPGTLLQGGLTPHDSDHYRQSVLHPGLMTPGLGVEGGMTPGDLGHGGLTPAGLHHGGMTPHHGGMTPHHGGMTPHHGGMTPHHGGMTPHHGGMTPHHGGMTPHHGGMTPHHGGMTPGGLDHGGMTPMGLSHGGLTPAGLQHGGMTPTGLQHGVMLQHGMEAMLSGAGEPALHPALHPVLDPALDPAPPTPLPLDTHHHYQSGLQMTNLGYDGHHSPQHDYDLPPSVEQQEEQEREAGETEEQFEERVLNRRAAQLFSAVRPRLAALAPTARLLFRDLAPPHNARKQVAQKFYSLLVLKKHQVLKLEQEETYGTLFISRGAQFETEAI